MFTCPRCPSACLELLSLSTKAEIIQAVGRQTGVRSSSFSPLPSTLKNVRDARGGSQEPEEEPIDRLQLTYFFLLPSLSQGR